MALSVLLLLALAAAGGPQGSEVLRGAAAVAPEVCTALDGRGVRAADDDDVPSGRPMDEDTAKVLEATRNMKVEGGAMDDAAQGLLGALADMQRAEGEADSIASAELIEKFAPGSKDRSKRQRSCEALGCVGAQGGSED